MVYHLHRSRPQHLLPITLISSWMIFLLLPLFSTEILCCHTCGPSQISASKGIPCSLLCGSTGLFALPRIMRHISPLGAVPLWFPLDRTLFSSAMLSSAGTYFSHVTFTPRPFPFVIFPQNLYHHVVVYLSSFGLSPSTRPRLHGDRDIFVYVGFIFCFVLFFCHSIYNDWHSGHSDRYSLINPWRMNGEWLFQRLLNS